MPAIVYAGISVIKGGFWIVVRNSHKYSGAWQIRSTEEELKKKIYSWLYKYSIDKRVKIVGAGITGLKDVNDLTADIWLKQDIVPFVFDLKGGGGQKKATAAALEVAKIFGFDEIIDVRFDPYRRVRTVRLAGLEDYKKISKNGDFKILFRLAEKFKKQQGRMAFFSSTPRGGGVALMRHSLIRLCRLLGIDVSWYVMNSKRTVFEITKKKFHNILQGVAPPDVRLSDGDKEVLEKWTIKNVNRFRKIFRNSGVIVIDDPQPSGMIPYIKKINPKAKIIYRSHIQIESGLIRRKGTSQNDTWDYLWKRIKKADVFVSHPIKDFIPNTVSRKKIVLMPASTDNLDGLNKKMSERQISYYLNMFNRELINNKQTPLDDKRPYIIQIARFDPSKGIPDVLESFRKLRKMLYREKVSKRKMPQLVIAGHGSIDDPEAIPVYNNIINMLKMDTYKHFRDDIKVVRLPNSDQMLNALFCCCSIALQLSHREGFEIKVTEAMEKGRPMIAYNTGGIPLQIENGKTGFLVKLGNTSQVARIMYSLLTDQNKYQKISKNAKKYINHDYFTVSNAAKWLFLASELLEKGRVVGNCGSVRKLMEKKFK